MDRCHYCGINLAKVDPKLVLVEELAYVSPNGGTRDHTHQKTGRKWCSSQCRMWTDRKDAQQTAGR